MICIGCGEEINDNVRHCSKCGIKQPEKQKPEEKPKIYCSSCNNELLQDWIICPYCGKNTEKLPKPESPFVFPDKLDDELKVNSAAISQDGKYIAVRIANNVINNSIQIIDANTAEIVKTIDLTNFINSSIIETDVNIDAVFSNNYYVKLKISFREPSGNSQKKSFFGIISNLFNHKYIHCILLINLNSKEKKEEVNNLFLSKEGMKYTALLYNKDNHCIAGFDGENVTLFNNDKTNIPDLCDDESYDKNNDNANLTMIAQGKVIDNTNDENEEDGEDEKNILLLFDEHLNQKPYKDFYACFRIYEKAIVVGYKNGSIHIIDAKTGKTEKKLKHGNESIIWVSYSSAGTTLITYDGNKIKFWI